VFKDLYAPIEPFASEWVSTNDGHEIYVEQVGNPDGIPVIFLHGGPGSSCKDHHRCFFNPQKYHVILMDQRGAGRSRPSGELQNNTTNHLLADLEMIRGQLNIDKWLVFGGSWGATLGLLYAQKFANKVLGLILRGTFLARKSDADWFLKEGANRLYPEAWLRFITAVPNDERSDLVKAYHQRLNSTEEKIRHEATREWDAWGGAVVLGEEFNPAELEGPVPNSAVAQARIETQYAINNYFIAENQILGNVNRLANIPCHIIHGRRDFMCPIESSFTLAQLLPEAQFTVLENSTHLAHGDEMIDALVKAADNFY